MPTRKSPSPNAHGLPSGLRVTLATAKTWQDEKFCLSVACPWCGKTPEDKAHVLSCSDPSAMQVWEMSLKHLKEWLKTQTTYQPITEAILNGLAQWRNPSTQPLNPRLDGWMDQDQIGWSGMLDGWVA